MNPQPIHGKAREWTRRWPRVELTETLSQAGAHVAHHFGSGKAAPDRRALWCQSGNPIEEGCANLRVKD